MDYYSEAHEILVTWVSSQPFAHNARSSLVRVGKKDKYCDNYDTEKKPLSYTPWNGTYFFFHHGRLFWLYSAQIETSFRREEILAISCLGRNPRPLKQLLSHCRAEYLKSVQNKTTVLEAQDRRWNAAMSRKVRPISTVIMNQNVQSALLDDIETYLDKGAQAWYSNRGIPYRKGYLLYGPPGTGKSSLSLSIAGHFGLDVYMLNISCVTGESLRDLLAELPPRCILLLEDVDAVHMTQSRHKEAEKDVHKHSTKSMESRAKLSLSELLNALDGVSAQEGRLLIMTTNHKEHLDDALIRAGRADVKVELPNADKEVIARIFCMVFKSLKDDMPGTKGPADDNETVEQLATEFASKVPEGEFSPAEIQSFLVENRESSRLPVKNVESWMTRMRREKTALASAASPKEQKCQLSPAASCQQLSVLPSQTADVPTSVSDCSVKERQRLVTTEQVQRLVHETLHQAKLSKLLRQKPLWACFDYPDPHTSMASYLEKELTSALGKIASATTAPHTPPPSEFAESTDGIDDYLWMRRDKKEESLRRTENALDLHSAGG